MISILIISITFNVIFCYILYEAISQKKKYEKVLNAYINAYHSLRHDIATPISITRNAYEFLFGVLSDNDFKLTEKEERYKGFMKHGINTSVDILDSDKHDIVGIQKEHRDIVSKFR